MRERSRSHAVAIACQCATQCVNRAAMLEKQGNGHSGIASVHVKGRPALGGVQEYFTNAAVGEAANPGRISDPVVPDVRELMCTTVGETLARHIGPPQLPHSN